MVGDEDEAPAGPPVGAGERVAQVVALAPPQLVVAGSRVDVLVTPEPRADRPGEAMLALEDVEVLAATQLGGEDGSAANAGKGAPGARVAASLRVTLRQAVYLAAVQDFARELRLLPRAAGDRSRGRSGLRMMPEFP
jgi:pilus assembly protein CpaB